MGGMLVGGCVENGESKQTSGRSWVCHTSGGWFLMGSGQLGWLVVIALHSGLGRVPAASVLW
jgi:hypothetical protein